MHTFNKPNDKSMVSVTPQYKSMLLVALVPALILLGAGFFLFSFKDYFMGLLFYSSTKNVPFLVSQSSPYQSIQSLGVEEESPQIFAVTIRKDEQGNLFAIWDDSKFQVWSVAIFEIPDVTPKEGMPDPVFLVRSPFQTQDGRSSIKFLFSPYKLGDVPNGFDVFPQGFVEGNLSLASGKKYFMQALNREETPEGVMTEEARFSFIYEVPASTQ